MDYRQQIVNAASRYGVPPEIALAVAQRESNFRQYDSGGQVLKGPTPPEKGGPELGIFQLMPTTAAGLGVNPNDPAQNIDGGVRYLSQLYGMTGDWTLALQAYNGGIGNVQRGTVSTAARGYASAVMGNAVQIAASNPGTLPTQSQVHAAVTPWNPFAGFEWPTLTVGEGGAGNGAQTLLGGAGGGSGDTGVPILAIGLLGVVALFAWMR